MYLWNPLSQNGSNANDWRIKFIPLGAHNICLLFLSDDQRVSECAAKDFSWLSSKAQVLNQDIPGNIILSGFDPSNATSSCFWIVGHVIGRMYCTFVILYTTRPLEQFSINFLLYFVAKNMCYNDCDWLWCCNVPTWSVGVFAAAESIRGLRFYKKILWAACRAVWYFVECWSLLPIVFGLAFPLVIQLQSWGRRKLFATSCSEKKQSYFIILKYDLWDMQLAITMDLFLPFFFYMMSWQICCIYVVFHNSIVWFMKEFEKSLLWSIRAVFVARGFDRTEVFEVV